MPWCWRLFQATILSTALFKPTNLHEIINVINLRRQQGAFFSDQTTDNLYINMCNLTSYWVKEFHSGNLTPSDNKSIYLTFQFVYWHVFNLLFVYVFGSCVGFVLINISHSWDNACARCVHSNDYKSSPVFCCIFFFWLWCVYHRDVLLHVLILWNRDARPFIVYFF